MSEKECASKYRSGKHISALYTCKKNEEKKPWKNALWWQRKKIEGIFQIKGAFAAFYWHNFQVYI